MTKKNNNIGSIPASAVASMEQSHNVWSTFKLDTDISKSVDNVSSIISSFIDDASAFVTGKTLYQDAYSFIVTENMVDAVAKSIVKIDNDIAKLEELKSKAILSDNLSDTQNGSDVGRPAKTSDNLEGRIRSYEISIEMAKINREDIHNLGCALLTICDSQKDRREPKSALSRSVDYGRTQGDFAMDNNSKMDALVAKRKKSVAKR